MNFVPLLELCYRYFVQFQMVNAIIQSFSRSLLLNDVMVEIKDAPLDGLPIKDLTFDVDPFEERATRSNNSKHRGNSENSITHMKGRVEELDITQNIIVKLFGD